MVKKDGNVSLDNVVALANNEVILNTFEGFEIESPRGKGFFTITNLRLIYYATSKDKVSTSVTVRETPIELVGEIASEFGKIAKRIQKTIGFIILMLGLGSLGFGLTALLSDNPLSTYAFIGGGVVFLVGLILLLTSKRKMFTLEIFTRSSRSSIVSLTSDLFQSPNRGRIKIKPNNQTMQMIRELGKYIQEAKSRRNNTN